MARGEFRRSAARWRVGLLAEPRLGDALKPAFGDVAFGTDHDAVVKVLSSLPSLSCAG
jgi:hypothetical protein